MNISTTAWAIALSMLLGAVGLTACTEYTDDGDGGTSGCADGDSIEVEGEPYCVFIEEGFLTEDCPPEYPNGFNFDDEVVVCSSQEEIPEEAVKDELRNKGYLDEEQPCATADDCPQPNTSPYCDGDVMVEPAPAGATCEEGVCGVITATVEDFRTDCAASGQRCEGGACVATTCATADDCPQPDTSPYCDGDVQVEPAPASATCEAGVCAVIAAGIPDIRTDCAADGQRCEDGACTDAIECAESTDCPQPSPYFGCEGTIAVRIVAGASCVQGQCSIDGDETRMDCAADGLACQDGECVEASEVTVTPGEELEVNAGHQGCETVADCAAVYIGCGACEGHCGGVNASYTSLYEEALVCDNYQGPECDFDCHPDFGLTELICDNGQCALIPAE